MIRNKIKDNAINQERIVWDSLPYPYIEEIPFKGFKQGELVEYIGATGRGRSLLDSPIIDIPEDFTRETLRDRLLQDLSGVAYCHTQIDGRGLYVLGTLTPTLVKHFKIVHWRGIKYI